MSGSLAAARTALQTIKNSPQALDAADGISLLSLKHSLLLSYLQSLVLVAARRVLGDSLTERTPPAQPFGARDRGPRGACPGDLVDAMIEDRIVLEKVDVLESKMRYQIEKLVRIADGPASAPAAADDPLAFKPNPMALMGDEDAHDAPAKSRTTFRNDGHALKDDDAIYRPPRLAPVPYVEKSKNKSRATRAPIPSALATLAADPAQPFLESTSGLGGAPALASGRAQYLKRLQDFEEDNFTRIIQKKSDARRRQRDEEDLALGGDLGGAGARGGRRRAGGLEDEFGEVLRSVGRVTARDGQGQGDGYEELRQRGKKRDVLERSRASGGRRHRDASDDEPIDAPRMKKRSRFEQETKVAKKRLSKR
ncbi:hypothetical protein HYPSUDRAFT_63240 [Hypholoma sublateritium FD-334 SS-4]|uniref:Neuroguidin n=1 Tax=Hypholoma sublateritium (strain FD-334 SS-4) TaxID=945553 RepID=A0A0D2MU73_HYPSF|nr:hypothetical protein HYPSUDRAFT_63240 [Hypholoma sublateritium FD-334 SS-4]